MNSRKIEFCRSIYSSAVDSVKNYIENKLGDEIEVDIVEYILNESQLHPFKFVPAKEISKMIENKYGKSKINPTQIMGGIRDKGAIIISKKERKTGGYKIPCNEAEVMSFFNDFSHNIIPQLRRIGTMNNELVQRTVCSVNILDNPQYEIVAKLVKEVENIKIKID